jgi:hypothetical protein
MATILFIHGTGIRRGSYFRTFASIQHALDDYEIAHTLKPCLWGDDLGASPPVHAVPDVTIRAPDRTFTRAQEYARWDILYRDPLFELRLLVNRPAAGPRPPVAGTAGRALWRRIEEYEHTEVVRAQIAVFGLEECWAAALKSVITNDPTARRAVEAATEIGEPAQAVARAIVASMLSGAFEAGLPLLDAGRRDALVDQLVDDWHARVAGVGAFLLGFIADMAASVASPLVKRRRGALTGAVNPAAGDILRYQARGEPIRAYIRKSIGDLDDDVYLLSHSLGGIASVDLLGSEAVPRVKGLITVGSQASYLHEIGALWGLVPGTTELPSHFPPWLNLYDPYDFLSYVVVPVFPRGVRDVRIESGQPFPHSHSAYWTNAQTWNAIRAFVT